MNDNKKEEKIVDILITIRKDEIKNERTGHYDDKTMAKRISKYLLDLAKKNIEEDNDEI